MIHVSKTGYRRRELNGGELRDQDRNAAPFFQSHSFTTPHCALSQLSSWRGRRLPVVLGAISICWLDHQEYYALLAERSAGSDIVTRFNADSEEPRQPESAWFPSCIYCDARNNRHGLAREQRYSLRIQQLGKKLKGTPAEDSGATGKSTGQQLAFG